MSREMIISPNVAGKFDSVSIDIELEPTKLRIKLNSLCQSTELLTDATLHLAGINNSNTEGINREQKTEISEDGEEVSAFFESLLPGRYWMHVVHQATLTKLPNRSGNIEGADSFQVSFFPRESYAEIPSGMTEELTLDLDPIPAIVRGRLWAADEVAVPPEDPCFSDPYRVFYQKQQESIRFVEHELLVFLGDDHEEIEVSTDESGAYTALVIPGIFGVQIPNMAD